MLVDAPGLITVVIWQGRVSQLRIHYLPGVVSWRLGRPKPLHVRQPHEAMAGLPRRQPRGATNQPINAGREAAPGAPRPCHQALVSGATRAGEGRFTELLYSCELFHQLSRNRYSTRYSIRIYNIAP